MILEVINTIVIFIVACYLIYGLVLLIFAIGQGIVDIVKAAVHIVVSLIKVVIFLATYRRKKYIREGRG